MTLREDEIGARKALGKRIQAAMDRRGFSHRGLADAILVSKQSVTNWTQGTHEPSLHHLRRLSRALGVPVVDLVEQNAPGAEAEAADALATFSSLRPVLQSLSESAPALLDLLTQAERQALAARRASQSSSPLAHE